MARMRKRDRDRRLATLLAERDRLLTDVAVLTVHMAEMLPDTEAFALHALQYFAAMEELADVRAATVSLLDDPHEAAVSWSKAVVGRALTSMGVAWTRGRLGL